MILHSREALSVHKEWQVFFKIKFFDRAWEYPHGREAFQMLNVRQDLLNNWPLEGKLEDPHGREAIQVHKGWQDILNILTDKNIVYTLCTITNTLNWTNVNKFCEKN